MKKHSPGSAPVLDPEIPEADRAALLARPDRLIASTRPAPRLLDADGVKSRLIGAVAAVVAGTALVALLAPALIVLLCVLAGLGALAGLCTLMRDWEYGPLAALGGGIFTGMLCHGVAEAIGSTAMRGFLATAAALGGAGWLVWLRRRLALNRTLATHHGSYVIACELDDIATGQLSRVDDAQETVVRSTALLGDAVDTLQAGTAFPHHRWQIAKSLSEQTARRTELAEAFGKDPGPQVRELLAAQRQALAVVTDSTERRIAAIEEYATHLTRALAAHEDLRSYEELRARNTTYEQMLAATVADDLAGDDLHALPCAAQATEATLAARLEELREAGQRLSETARSCAP
ncbi:hypothetical protein ACIO3O_33135 [Streptomyces sp. NPDC087440]|uniref:hypothetical protein n=1 Tax=Streptomyces sp. NPDC087440 TaxID=3365790 RepID=UPI0037FFAE94